MPVRDYQERAIDGVAKAHGKTNRVLVSAPCGAGKTHIAQEIIRRELDAGGRAVFITDRIAITAQTIRRFGAAGLPVGVLWADETRDTGAPCLVASAQTVLSRGLEHVGRRTLAVLDEAHVDRKASYAIVRDVLRRGGRAVGLTGTPLGPGAVRWRGMVSSPPMAALAKEGYAIVPRIIGRWTPDDDDMDDLVVGPGGDADGEWTASSGGELMERFADVVADDVLAWVREEGLSTLPRTILFGATQVAARRQMAALEARGVRCAEVFDGTPRRVREQRIAALEAGGLQVLGSVSALSVGFDSPAAEVMIGLRPLRRSVAEFLQSAGRIARPSAGKERAVILDYTGNADRFGDYARTVWEHGWAGLPRKAPVKAKRVWVCDSRDDGGEKCGQVNAPHRHTCILCGALKPVGKSRFDPPTCRRCDLIQRPGATVCSACGRPLPSKQQMCGEHHIPLQTDELTTAELDAGRVPRVICPHPGCDWVDRVRAARREQVEVFERRAAEEAARADRQAREDERTFRQEFAEILRGIQEASARADARSRENDPDRADLVIADAERRGSVNLRLAGSHVKGSPGQAWVIVPRGAADAEDLSPYIGARVEHRGAIMGRIDRILSRARPSQYRPEDRFFRAELVRTAR